MWVDDATCGGGDVSTADYKSGNIDASTGTGTDYDRTVKSGNTTAYSTDGTTFSWVVTFTSSNSGIEDVSSPCTNETSSISIDNGATQPPAGP
jgi:hypothetical protein